MAFIHQFDGLNDGVIDHWFESQIDSAVSVGLDSVKHLLNRAVFARRFENVKLTEDRDASAIHVKDPAAGSTLAPIARPEECLREKQT